jgi:crossover junction endodeoxyribonuclease RuvC
MTARILAIDPSLAGCAVATAIAGLDATVQRIRTKPVERIEVHGRDPVRDVRGAVHRYRAIADRIATIARRGSQLDLVLIEGYAFVDGQAGELDRIELGGVIRDRLADVAPIVEVAPATLKKFATGNGRASKDEMIGALASRHGHAFKSNDEADAFALLMLGLCVLDPGSYKALYTKPQLESVRKIGEVAASAIAEFHKPRSSDATGPITTISTDPARIAAARSEQQKALF